MLALNAAIFALYIPGRISTFIRQDINSKMIDLAKHVPREGGSAVMTLPWGPRYDAVAFSKYVSGENADLALVDHKANFGVLAAQGHTLCHPHSGVGRRDSIRPRASMSRLVGLVMFGSEAKRVA